MQNFESEFLNHMVTVCGESPDPSHDILHVQRVVRLARDIGEKEGANMEVVIPSAYLHDSVYISKADERRSKASLISADFALELLDGWGYPKTYYKEIHHAIHAHSFSAKVKAETLEAQVIQDADRLDAIGAVGLMRCFGFSGLAKRPFYNAVDPFCLQRQPDDSNNTLDHFFIKLLKLCEGFNTKTGQEMSKARGDLMDVFLAALKEELGESVFSSTV